MDKNTLYVSDLDGTLLNPDSIVSEKSAELLSSVSSIGGLFTVATARTPATVVPLLRNVRSSVPCIVMTGAALWDRRDNRYIHTRFLTAEAAEYVAGEFRKVGICPFFYCLPEDGNLLEVYHNGSMNRKMSDFYLERRNLNLKKFIFGKDVPAPLLGRTLLVFAIEKAVLVEKLAETLTRNNEISVSAYPDIFNRDWSVIEIYAGGVSKASAIEFLRDHISASEVVVFGDNLNDIPMFRVADRAVAVSNAFQEVKDSADIVIGSNAEDAVAHFIMNDFLKR